MYFRLDYTASHVENHSQVAVNQYR